MKKFTIISFALFISFISMGQEQKKGGKTIPLPTDKNVILRQRLLPEEMATGKLKHRTAILNNQVVRDKDIIKTRQGYVQQNLLNSASDLNSGKIVGPENSFEMGEFQTNDLFNKMQKFSNRNQNTIKNNALSGSKSLKTDANKQSQLKGKKVRDHRLFGKPRENLSANSDASQGQINQNTRHLRSPFFYTDGKAKLPAKNRLKGGNMQKLDSIVKDDYNFYYNPVAKGESQSSKSAFEYDARGNCIREAKYDWAPMETLQPYYKTENTFDSLRNKTSNAEYIWDQLSASWIGSNQKWERSFDADSNQTSYTQYSWDYNWMTGLYQWIGVNKYEATYDAQHRNTLYYEYTWDMNSNNWIGSKKDEYAYDLNGNSTLVAYYRNWSTESNNWTQGWKNEYVYDENGNELSYIYSYWDSSSNTWLRSSKDERQYDTIGKLDVWFQFNWTGSDWYGYKKSTYAYDTTEKCLGFSGYDWDSFNSQWFWSSKGDYTYDANNKLEFIYEYTGDGAQDIWSNYSKKEWQYDANGYNTLSIYSTWDSYASDWVGSYKYESIYDSSGNLTSDAYYDYFDTYALQWRGSYKYENTYDTSRHQTSSIHYNWDNYAYSWVKSDKWEKSFDSYGNLTSGSDYTWDTYQNNWVGNGTKWETYFDATGRPTSGANYNWDYYLNQWIGLNKWESTFDAYNRRTSYASYNWDYSFNRWIGQSKSSQTFNDTTGLALTNIFYNWDADLQNWVNNFKYEFVRDENNRILYFWGYSWLSATSEWFLNYKQVYDYNADGKCIDQLGYFWNKDSNTGTIDDKNEYIYDVNGNYIIYNYYKWDGVEKKWVITAKNEYSYDTDSNRISNIQYSFQPSSNMDWKLATQNNYHFDVTGKMTSMEYKEFGNESYEDRQDFTYDTNGNLIRIEEFRWNENSFQWELSYKSEYTFNANGKRTMVIEGEWDNVSGNWAYADKYDIVYNANGYATSWIESNWDAVFSQWLKYYKGERGYDANNNCILELQYSWDMGSSQWQYYYEQPKAEYTYSPEGKALTQTTYSWKTDHLQIESQTDLTYNASGYPILVSSQSWDTIAMAMKNSYKTVYGFDANGNLILETGSEWNGSSWDTIDYEMDRQFDLSVLRNQLFLSWMFMGDYENLDEEYYWFGDVQDMQAKFYNELYKTNNKMVEEKTWDSNYLTGLFELSSQDKLYYSDFTGLGELAGLISTSDQTTVTAGYVKLFDASNEDRFLQIDSVLINVDGSYRFTNVPFGTYIIEAVADTQLYKRAIATYYGNTGLWSEAHGINANDSVTCDTLNIQIILLPFLNGKTTLSGTVVESQKKSAGIRKSTGSIELAGRPMKGASVVLVGKSSKSGGVILATTLTDEEGRFEFRNVPSGDYDILVDIPGLEMLSYHSVTVTEEETNVVDLDYVVGTEGVIINGLGVFSMTNVVIYPNPGRDRINIILPEWKGALINICDLQGKMIYQLEAQGRELILDHHLSPGIYLIIISQSDRKSFHKLVVQ